MSSILRVRNAEKEIFMRVLSLFQLTAGFSSPIGENPIFGLLQLNMGVVKFPVCEVLFDQPLFSSLDELKRLEIARGMLEDANLSFEERRFPDVKSIYLKALPAWETIIEDKGLTAKISSLPPYQRKFSSGYLYTKVMERGLEALERLDEKSDAINGYMQLLEQTTYVPHHRGDWFNRLTILLIRVDKRLDAAAKLLLRGIRDHLVRPQHRLELCDRLRRISNRLTAPTRKQITCQETSWTVREPVVVEIRGKLCPTEQSGRSGFHVMFMQQDSASRVEELALTHYLEAGFSQGVHAEGSLFTSLFGLLCWDIIYEQPIANVFRSKYQTAPLDLTCPTFHTSRKTAIEAKIETITGQSIADSAAACLAVWNEQNGVHTPVVSWDLLPSCEYLSGLLHCFQPRQLARIVHRYANDFAAVRAGFPDLTLWNPVTKALKVVEVKGPNDRLSHKQSIWIDFLMDIGVDVEVCHVVASGAKRKSSVLEDV
ncbi:Fanconi-associated nuclease 1 [Hypsibius exemplaris]|uniref:Fanconi-associated nuclease n=1 Tax=Hypsibius exemplaris TaxID=2072580 RepID=A0A1W0WD74_HYPEX|nr:Fanconi-associated nuclease 1 [Hypsibius exemplaris]